MNISKNETWQDSYLRLLSGTPEEESQRSDLSQEDLQLVSELCDEDFIDGKIDLMADGSLNGYTNGLTVKGRIFYDEQKKIKLSKSLASKTRKVIRTFLTWLSGVITAYIIHKMKNG